MSSSGLAKVVRDPRFIYLVLAVVIAAPIIARLSLVVPVSPTTRAVYNYIQELEANQLIVLSFDYSPNSAPELHPQAIVITQHAFMKQLKIIIVGQWTDGPTLGEAVLESVDKRGAEYGRDFVNLGFIPNIPSIIGMTQDFGEVFPRDIRGTPTADMPLLRLYPNAQEAALVVSFTGGEPGITRYLQYWNAPLDIPVALGATALAAPGFLPFYDSGQLVGILISLRAAGEYETLIRTDNISGAASAMISLSLAHITIVGAVVVGNIALLLSRRNRGGKSK